MKPITLPIKNIDRRNRTVWVQSHKTVFPCKITKDYLAMDMQRCDKAVVVKSAVSGEWLCIDYEIAPITEVDYAIHNSYQTNIDDLILNEEGVPYE